MTVQRPRPRAAPPARRFPWYLLTGLILGTLMGIAYAWLITPVQYLDTEPASLQAEFKDQYRVLIAAAYAANHDLARAQDRLALLKDSNIGDTLAAQAQRALAAGHPAEEVRALAELALVANAPPASIPTAAPLTQFPTLTALPLETPTFLPTDTALPPAFTETPQPTNTEETATDIPSTPETGTPGTPGTSTPVLPSRTPTPTLLPSNTPSPVPTSLSPFLLDQRTLLCDPDILGPLLIVQTLENKDTGIPGIEIILNWSGGEEHFFTGLKPELGLGYADFAMMPDISYTLRLADGSQLITDLTAAQCEADNGDMIWGSWELIFIQP